MKQDHPLDSQAYLDNELSSEKALDFESKLSDSDKANLEKQAQFNLSLEKSIKSKQVECPDHIWNQLTQEINPKKLKSEITEVPTFYSFLPTLIKIAAVILAGIFFFNSWNLKKNPQVNSTPSNNLLSPSITGDFQLIQNTLKQQGIQINIGYQAPNKPGHHEVRAIGMDWVQPSKARLIFICCDVPVIVYLEEKQPLPYKPSLKQDHPELLHHANKSIRNYFIKAHSDHPPSDVLDIIY